MYHHANVFRFGPLLNSEKAVYSYTMAETLAAGQRFPCFKFQLNSLCWVIWSLVEWAKPQFSWVSESKLLSQARLFVTPWTVAPPGSSVHGIFQARILEWLAVFSFRGSSQPMDRTPVSCIGRWVLYCLSHQGSLVTIHRAWYFLPAESTFLCQPSAKPDFIKDSFKSNWSSLIVLGICQPGKECMLGSLSFTLNDHCASYFPVSEMNDVPWKHRSKWSTVGVPTWVFIWGWKLYWHPFYLAILLPKRNYSLLQKRNTACLNFRPVQKKIWWSRRQEIPMSMHIYQASLLARW